MTFGVSKIMCFNEVKVKGKGKVSDGWSDVPDSGNSSFRFFTVETELP